MQLEPEARVLAVQHECAYTQSKLVMGFACLTERDLARYIPL